MIVLNLLGSVITILCLVLCMILYFRVKSKNPDGSRRVLSSKTVEAPWSLGTWIAGVFVAGTGVALMYAPADLVAYINKGLNPVESITIVSLLNSAPVWALYAVMGLWYMKYMDTKAGKIMAMLSTVFGMSISLYTGVNTISRFIGVDIPCLGFVIAGIIVFVAMLSARFNLLKGISTISFSVFVIAALALISIPTSSFIPTKISGCITSNLFTEYMIGDTSASWIFWFLSWSPTVARWLAHISKGRTMKEYIAGTIILPTLLAVVWMTISWIYQDVIVNSFILNVNISYIIPCSIFILSGMLFMIGTLDSDCTVFTDDLSDILRVKRSNKFILYYGFFVISLSCIYMSGIVSNPFGFNQMSSLVFVPLIIQSIIFVVGHLKLRRDLYD